MFNSPNFPKTRRKCLDRILHSYTVYSFKVFNSRTKSKCSTTRLAGRRGSSPWARSSGRWCTTTTSSATPTTSPGPSWRRNTRLNSNWRRILFPRRLSPTVCSLKVGLRAGTFLKPQESPTHIMSSGLDSLPPQT